MRIRVIPILFILILSIQPLKAQFTLDECIDYAIKNNISIKQMRILQSRAEVDFNSAKMALLPNINAGVGQNWSFGRTQTQSGLYENRTQSNTSFSLNSSLSIFAGGRIINTIGKAKLDLQISVCNLLKAQNDIALNVTSLFFEVLFQKELLKIAQEKFATTSQQTTLTEILALNGKVPQWQLLDITAQKANDTLSLVQASHSLKLALLDLAQALEIKDAENFDIAVPAELDADATGNILLLSYRDIYDRAIKNRPEIQSAELGVRSAEKSLKIARSSYFPTISLHAGIGSNYFYLHNNVPNLIFRDQLNNNLSQYIGLNLNIPIFERLSTFNSCRQAKLNVDNQKLALEHSQKQLFKEIQTAYLNLVAAIERRRTSQQLIVSAEEAFVYAKERYNNGKSSVFDFAQAQSQLVRAQAEQAQAKYDYLFKIKVMEFYLR
ncbi:MAG: TolC family protein [Porphyromonadaceae bacterium]|nr:TolC family protein [Porphyromonadaceae bacterium]